MEKKSLLVKNKRHKTTEKQEHMACFYFNISAKENNAQTFKERGQHHRIF